MIWLPLLFTRSPHTDLFRSTDPTQGRTLFLSLILLGTSLSFSTCDESLPAYHEPDVVLEATLSAQYVLDFTDNSLKVYLTARNIFDETLQSKADVTGTVELELLKKTFFLSVDKLIQGRYNAGSRVLTFNPRDSVRLGVHWEFIDDRGGICARRNSPTAPILRARGEGSLGKRHFLRIGYSNYMTGPGRSSLDPYCFHFAMSRIRDLRVV